MTENIADQIREDRRPEEKMFALSGEAKLLRCVLAVAQKRLEVEDDATGVLATRAEYTRDQLEEELSKTALEMEVLAKRGDMKDAPMAATSSTWTRARPGTRRCSRSDTIRTDCPRAMC